MKYIFFKLKLCGWTKELTNLCHLVSVIYFLSDESK